MSALRSTGVRDSREQSRDLGGGPLSPGQRREALSPRIGLKVRLRTRPRQGVTVCRRAKTVARVDGDVLEHVRRTIGSEALVGSSRGRSELWRE